MNIAIFGWYHHRNAGDDRMAQCLVRWLEGHTLAFLPAGRPPPLDLLRSCDAALIGGGGLIMDRGGVFRDVARWMRRAGIPVALAGVSAERLDEPLRRELRAALGRAVFAWFRDRASLAAVGEHPRAFVAPDLTWLYPLPEAPAAGAGLAVALSRRPGFDAASWRRALAALDAPLHPLPLYFENGGDAALIAELLGPQAVPEELDLAPLRHAAAVLTSRYHGLIFALQSGRPALVTGEQPKLRRFLAEHELEDWAVAGPQELASRWRRMERDLAAHAARARRLRRRLHDEVWRRTEEPRERLLAAAAALPPPGRRPLNRLRRLLDFGDRF